ncbi:hypothetical protein GGR09_001173 [Bartonella heixiaziensis]
MPLYYLLAPMITAFCLAQFLAIISGTLRAYFTTLCAFYT